MKKLVCLALTAMLLLALCFALTSCGECKEHEWDAGTTVAATCTENGKYVYTCTKCDATKDVAADPSMSEDAVLIATGHKKNASTGEVTTAATCTEDGVKAFDCMICGAKGVVTEEVKATGHKYSRTLSAADGKHYYACTVEGCTAKDSETACDYATVAVDAAKHKEVCTVCETAKADSEVAHTFGDPTTTPATCTKAGAETKTCADCGYKAVTELPMLAHEYDETKYGSNDEKHWIPCKVCGVAKDGTEAIHSFGAEATTQPTDGSCLPGKVSKTCEDCGKEVILSYIPSDTAHTFAFDAEASEMTEGGINPGTLVYACSACEFAYTIDAVAVKNFDDKSPAGGIWGTLAGDASVSYDNGNVTVVGPVVKDETLTGSNFDINCTPTSEQVTLADNSVMVFGFDIGAPAGGFNENGWKMSTKFGNKWGNPEMRCDGSGNLTYGDVSLGTLDATKMSSIIVKYVSDPTAKTITYQIWIDGVLKATGSFAWNAEVADGTTFVQSDSYINITIPPSASNEALDRGFIVDNIFYADEVPAFLAGQTLAQ